MTERHPSGPAPTADPPTSSERGSHWLDSREAEWERLALRHLRGGLEEHEARDFRAALVRDPVLRRRYERLSEAWHALELPTRELEQSMAAELVARIEADAEDNWSSAIAAPPWSRAAAVAALASGLLLGLATSAARVPTTDGTLARNGLATQTEPSPRAAVPGRDLPDRDLLGEDWLGAAESMAEAYRFVLEQAAEPAALADDEVES